MNDQQSDWRWADANGAQNAIDERDLVASLSNGELPACTLVWRKGWNDWLPASQVGELASALPAGQREPSIKPRVTGTVKPPPAPLYKYNARLTQDAAAKLLAKTKAVTRSQPPSAPPRPNGQPRPSKVPPPFPGRAAMRSARPPPPPMGQLPTPTPPPPPQRPPVPTLIEMAPATVTGTLRPPAAVPPPPRGLPALRTAEPAPESFQNVVTTTSTPLPPQATATPLPSIVIAEKSVVAPVPRTEAASAPFIAELPNPTPPPWDAQVPRPPVTGSALSTAPSSIPPPKGSLFLRRGQGVSALTIGLSGAAALLALVVVVLLIARGGSEEEPKQAATAEEQPPTAKAPVSSAKPEAPPAPNRACSIGTSAKRVSPAIVLSVPPYVSQVPASQRIAIGLATSRTDAAGLTLDAASLDAARTFKQAASAGVVGVVPLTKTGELSFAVDRDDAKLKSARTVDATAPFTVGMNDKGFARVLGDGEPEVVWLGEPEEKITEIRVASIDKVGHALTFRRGGQSGKVLAGWLTPEGKAKTPLSVAKASQPMVGTPTLAANDEAVLLAFATRADEGAKWSVELGSAPHGELPRSMRRLAIPPGGPGGEAISPAATGLPKGGWFIQWTEGSSGKRRVRGQLLDRELVPIGDALDLSPESENSGQGLVLLQNDRVVSMFLVQAGKSHELWATSLSCR